MKSNAHLRRMVTKCSIVFMITMGTMCIALRYKPAGRGFYSRWYHWNFSVT